jgi:hypothetical protein
MNEADKKKLRGILRKINTLKKEVEDLISSESTIQPKKAAISDEAKKLLTKIERLSIGELEDKLNTLCHKDLGEVFVGAGGSGGDKRKPKAWLIERILWLSKEFSKGHQYIRES